MPQDALQGEPMPEVLKVGTAVQNSDRQKVPSGPPMTAVSVQSGEAGSTGVSGIAPGVWKFFNVDPGTKSLSTPAWPMQ